MKKVVFILGLFLLVFFSGCSNDSTVDPPQNGETGRVALNFDKANAPASVVNVTATLTREGYTTVTGTLNIQNDSSATLLLTGLAVGSWNLKVDASDSSSSVLYSGETPVIIQAGFTTQISLTLVPTGQGTGDVHITVNWGTALRWVDYFLNPILKRGNNTFDQYGVWSPKVLIENGQYKMWFTNLANGGIACVGYAVSSDGLTWTKPVTTPVLTPGWSYSWDSHSVSSGPVIKVENTYRMYYTGTTSNSASSHIGLATSPDGITWTKYNNPVLSAGSGYDYRIAASDIIKIDDLYYLYYSAVNYPAYSICLATSPDGLNWTKYPQNPILTTTKTWEGTGVYHPSIAYSNGKYYMTYQNVNDNLTAFGIASSVDGKIWTKDVNNPFFTNNDTYNHWIDYICYPELEIIGNEWRVYYSVMNTSLERFIAVVRKL